MRFRILYTRNAVRHVAELQAGHRRRLSLAIPASLGNEPDLESRHRKRLRQNAVAPFELRVDSLRVFYEVDVFSKTVVIVAVGWKRGASLWLDGEERKL